MSAFVPSSAISTAPSIALRFSSQCSSFHAPHSTTLPNRRVHKITMPFIQHCITMQESSENTRVAGAATSVSVPEVEGFEVKEAEQTPAPGDPALEETSSPSASSSNDTGVDVKPPPEIADAIEMQISEMPQGIGQQVADGEEEVEEEKEIKWSQAQATVVEELEQLQKQTIVGPSGESWPFLEGPRSYRAYLHRKNLRQQWAANEKDTGSAEYQIASLTSRIQFLTEHLKKNPKDYSSTRGVIRMVNRRRKLLLYLKGKRNGRFEKVVEGLGIRINRQMRSAIR